MRAQIATRLLAIAYSFIISFGLWSCAYSSSNDLGDIDLDINIHDGGYMNSRIVDINYNEMTVQVLTIDGIRMDILFKGDIDFMVFLKMNSRVSSLLPVTFYCNGKRNEECNLKKPYSLIVATRKVEPIIVHIQESGR